ncbi:hypothetical protein O988_07437 [Pseudogymnoascus sp. VKM F-3808]|nr:hypothetical protein O988_07437 [Pseudogymnoascus sp. VKM F-3808]
MKFSSTTVALILLPILSIASPITKVEATEEGGPVALVSEPRSEDGIFKRSSQLCQTINVSTYVNCRAGPGTGYKSIMEVPKGSAATYKCYKRGECINGNCTWDYIYDQKCYVNGYYTDSYCSIAKLGPC